MTPAIGFPFHEKPIKTVTSLACSGPFQKVLFIFVSSK
jgi:hypothetical protein